MPNRMPLNVFVSYSHNEEDRPLLDKLSKHLAHLHTGEGKAIHLWDDSHIKPGDKWDDEIRENLNDAHIVLLLVSADFNSSRYIREVEMKEAMARHGRGECRVVPVLLRPCDYSAMPYARFEMLPKDPKDQKLKPITDRNSWQSEDFAMTEVAKRIRELVRELQSRPELPSRTPTPVHQPTWDSFFENHPHGKKLELLHTVNCDRFPSFQEQLQKHFEAYENQPVNLFYLLTACRSQKPESLISRLCYWFEEELTALVRSGKEEERDLLAIPELEVARKPQGTFANFWNYTQAHLAKKGSFEDFVLNPEDYIPGNSRLLLAFSISEQVFREYEAERHISFILEQFARLPEKYRRFVFCFVQYAPDIHKRLEARDRIEKLDRFVAPPPPSVPWYSGKHISCLPRVSEEDLKIWLEGRFEKDYCTKLLGEFSARHCSDPDSADFDMRDIEAMQKAAYLSYRNHYQC